MKKTKAGWLYSPSDLITFMESPYASAMERLRSIGALKDGQARDPKDALMDMLSKKGVEFESSVTNDFADEHPDMVVLPDGFEPEALAALTREAMDAGAPVIAQAYLTDGLFGGHADYLKRVEIPCASWPWSYEVWDSKLARTIKPYFLLQLCCYSELLDTVQGGQPEHLVVVTGDGHKHRFRVAEFSAYYRALKTAFLEAHVDEAAEPPDPALDASHGRWSECAKAELEERDHLSRTANIRRTQIRKLESAGILTMASLAELDDEFSVPRLDAQIRQRLSAQARLQRASSTPPPTFEVLPHESMGKPRGLDALPPHDDGDIFFDLEGHPGEEEGLEYLWGATFHEPDGTVAFRDFWGHDAVDEERAFTDFVDWAHARWEAHPGMHIYHYAPYEITALRKLMGRTGKREAEVDRLLKNDVFVDLYSIVRNALIIGEPRYSIKNLENIYWHDRGGRDGVQNGGESIEVYERWRNAPDGDGPETSELLKLLYDYNKEDCDSTLALAQWLRTVQAEHDIAFRVENTGLTTERTEAQIRKAQDREDAASSRIALAAALEARDGCDVTGLSAEGFTLLGQCLEFHRREAKPGWWRYFDREQMDDDALYADQECLVGVTRTERPPFKLPSGRGHSRYEYSYDLEQPYKGTVKAFKALRADGLRLSVDPDHTRSGRLVFACKDEPPPSLTLIPDDRISHDALVAAIHSVAERAHASDLPSRAIVDILERGQPRSSTCVSSVAACRDDSDAFLAAASRIIRDLDGSAVCVQGPPGAGKTYTASHVIADLLESGAAIGITANSHKASDNLLEAVMGVCEARSIPARIVKVQSKVKAADVPLCQRGAELAASGSKIEWNDDPTVIGGTAWCFSDDNLDGRLDYLFIDEAGQYALANLIAVSRSAHNLVLLGDQMQLSQPTQGIHPGDSGLSCLDYVLNGESVIADTQGIFLPASYRMHPLICGVISEQIYAGRLAAAQRCHDHVLGGHGELIPATTGIVWHPVEHNDNAQSSQEEAEAIALLVEDLLQRSFHARTPEDITLDDILIVTPYNAQKELLSRTLPLGARIGTVDLFQGQEAPVVILSLAASSADLAPRGIDFLFSINRLNVAVSRAQALAIIVGSDSLVSSTPNSVQQMQQLNLFCRLREGSVIDDQLPDSMTAGAIDDVLATTG